MLGPLGVVLPTAMQSLRAALVPCKAVDKRFKPCLHATVICTTQSECTGDLHVFPIGPLAETPDAAHSCGEGTAWLTAPLPFRWILHSPGLLARKLAKLRFMDTCPSVLIP